MKKIRVLLLTLVLSVSLLAPEFSMLPAVYADDETPAAILNEELSDSAEAAGSEAAAEESAEEAETAEEDEAAAASGAAAESLSGASDESASEAGLELADPEEPAAEFNSYDMLYMTKLYEDGIFKVPDSITVKPAEYGNGLLFKGKVKDLNSTYITFEKPFNFDAGGVGRLYIDGLKDKDRGMKVEVEVYLDDSKSPIKTIELKKQMGKKEWANKGDKSVSLGSKDISGKHKVALLLKISGKKDKDETTVMLRTIQFCKTTVPVMYFNIDESEGTIEQMNNSEDHSVECYGTVDLVVPDKFNADETFRDEYEKQESLTGLDLEYIRGRGNSTWMDPKKPYKVKFDKAQDLFGFGKNKHWVLLANRYDNSLIRNRMTYWLGQQLGMEFTPQCVPVEVVMNGEFYGSYLLCEQIRVGKGRVTIDDLDDQDPLAITDEQIRTGGYLLSLDSFTDDEKRSFTTENGMDVYIESPDENVEYFSEYIKAYTQKVENAIFGEGFKDAAGHPYTDYLDMDAAVDYWWIQEFSENGDAFISGSTYLYKKRESTDDPGKLYWGPLWDFDFVAWGDLDYESSPMETLDYTKTPWFEEMKCDPVFIKAVKERWSEKGGIKEKIEEITKEGGRLDKYIEQMETTYKYDHDLWGPYESELTEYKAEIEQLRTWINKRLEYVDKEVGEMSVEPHRVTFKADGKIVSEADVIGILRKGDIPEAPEKPGYVFSSWADEEGFDYEEGSRITEDIVLYASYIKEDEVVEAKDIFFRNYEVYYPVFPMNGGSTIEDWYYPEYTVMPGDAFDTNVTFTSSNPDVAEAEDAEGGELKLKALGDATITATLKNGVTRSFELHVINYEDMKEYESTVLDRDSVTLKEGEYTQVLTISSPMPCEPPEFIWVSTNEEVAAVNDHGVITGVGPGTTDLLVVNTMTREIMKVKVTVKSNSNVGKIVKRNGSTYKITSDKKGSRRAMLIKAKNASKVVIPAYIKLGGKKYYVNKIKAKAFAKSKATRVTVKTKKLSKARVRGSLRGSKVKKIVVRVGKAKANRTYVKKYKKIFTKKNAGKGVVVSK